MKKKQHAVLDSENLARAVNAATELENKEKAEQEQARLEGRRSELDDLPPGHPLRVAMELAKEQYDRRMQFEKDQEEGKKIRQARKARKAKKAEARQAERDEEEQRHKSAASELNKGIDKLVGDIASFGKVVDENQKVLVGGARIKVARLKRLLLAAHRGLITSKLNVGRIE